MSDFTPFIKVTFKPAFGEWDNRNQCNWVLRRTFSRVTCNLLTLFMTKSHDLKEFKIFFLKSLNKLRSKIQKIIKKEKMYDSFTFLFIHFSL